MSMATLCNTTVTLLRATVTLDALGGEVRAYAAVNQTPAPARVLAKSGTERDIEGRRSEQHQAQVLTPVNLGAKVGDVIQDNTTMKQYLVVNQVDEGAVGQVFSIFVTAMDPVS